MPDQGLYAKTVASTVLMGIKPHGSHKAAIEDEDQGLAQLDWAANTSQNAWRRQLFVGDVPLCDLEDSADRVVNLQKVSRVEGLELQHGRP